MQFQKSRRNRSRQVLRPRKFLALALGVIVAGTFAVAGPASADIATDLVAHYPLDGDTLDYSGNNLDGIPVGPVPVADRFGNPNSAYRFNGVTDYIELGTPDELRLTGPMTVSAWFRADPSGLTDHRALVARSGRDVLNAYSWELRQIQGAAEAWVSGNGHTAVFATGAEDLVADEWHHMTMTYEPAVSLAVYLDGKLVQETTSSVPEALHDPAEVSIRIGASWYTGGAPSNQWAGDIDEVRIYSRALSPGEVRELAALVAYYPFDGDTLDYSGNNLDGIPVGPVPVADRFGNPNSAYRFNGVTDYIELGTPDELRLTGPMTVSAWFRADPSGLTDHRALVARSGRDVLNAYSWELRQIQGAAEAWVSGNGHTAVFATGAEDLVADEWHHMTMTYEPAVSLAVYLDGKLVQETTSSVPEALHDPAEVSIRIGASWYTGGAPSNQWAGDIDEVRIYSRALSPGEVRELAALVAYYPFDGDTLDYSGNNLDGIPVGPVPVADRFGNPNSAYRFNGVTDYIELGTPDELRLTGPMTVSAWFRADPSGLTDHRALVARSGRDVLNAYSWELRQIRGAAEAWVSGNGHTAVFATGPDDLVADEWHHMTMTYEPGVSLAVYLDGKLVQETTSSVPEALHDPAEVSIRIGASWYTGGAPSNQWAGDIDEVRIYSQALSPEEIAVLLGGPCVDGLDNDGDGRIDFPADPGCKDPTWSTENPQCQDGINNNQWGEDPNPGHIDYDGGTSLDLDEDGYVDPEFNLAMPKVTDPDPQCVGKPWKKREGNPSCGLGAELGLLLPPLMWLWRRRSRLT